MNGHQNVPMIMLHAFRIERYLNLDRNQSISCFVCESGPYKLQNPPEFVKHVACVMYPLCETEYWPPLVLSGPSHSPLLFSFPSSSIPIQTWYLSKILQSQIFTLQVLHRKSAQFATFFSQINSVNASNINHFGIFWL